MKTFRLLLLAIFVSSFVSLSCSGPQTGQRYFKEPSGKQTWNALNCLSCKGEYARLVEVDQEKKPLTGDTVLVWLQHFQERGVSRIQPEARKAELIVSCYPNKIETNSYLQKHVFPDHSGIVCITWMKNDYVIVTEPTTGSCKNLDYPPSFEEIEN